jgi:hypothetical protein
MTQRRGAVARYLPAAKAAKLKRQRQALKQQRKALSKV